MSLQGMVCMNSTKSGPLLKGSLYIGAIILLLLFAISFNTLRVVNFNGAKTIRVAQDRFKLENLEFQIKDAVNASPREHQLYRKRIEDIDDKLARYEQLLSGQKLPTLELVKKKWDLLKKQSAPDPSDMIHELDQLHRAINTNILDDLAKRQTVTEKDISRLRFMKIITGVLMLIMVVIAMYVDTLQTKLKNELLKRLHELEEEKTNSISKETAIVMPKYQDQNIFEQREI